MPDFDYFNWIIFPLLIFCSRLVDVSLGTMRHIFVARGFKKFAPLLGFFEVLIWIIVAKQIFNEANSWQHYVAWAAGFATGNYIGLILEERLALGLQMLRIITDQDCEALVKELTAGNHGISIVDGQGSQGPIKIIFTVVARKNLKQVIAVVLKHNPTAFYSIEDVRNAQSGVFSSTKDHSFFSLRRTGKQQ
jgi:uncharacterized protein YebE (UPF0316 family)